MYSSILTERSFVTISLLSDFSSRLAEKVIQLFKYTQKCFTKDCISFQLYLALAFVTICTFALLHCLRSSFGPVTQSAGGSIAEWLACWTQAQKAWVQIAAASLSGSSLRQSVHTHRASVHQAAKLVAALLRVAGVTAGLAESNGSLPPGLW